MIRLILNILWFILGGWISGLLWFLGGLLLAITIVGLPYTGAAWRIAGFAFWPFGKEVVSREIISGQSDLGTGPVGFLLNVIWFLLGGWYIALSHLLIAIAEAITIIGIPFAIKDLQLAFIALAPIGKVVVEKR
ncbi:MAG: YccF domain-containing protein [Caulobacter sp.]|nr:YccF domain-containing protein [Caulobacter sp.]